MSWEPPPRNTISYKIQSQVKTPTCHIVQVIPFPDPFRHVPRRSLYTVNWKIRSVGLCPPVPSRRSPTGRRLRGTRNRTARSAIEYIMEIDRFMRDVSKASSAHPVRPAALCGHRHKTQNTVMEFPAHLSGAWLIGTGRDGSRLVGGSR